MNTRTALATATLSLTALFTASALVPRASARAAPNAAERVEATGIVSTLRIDADGTLYVLLQPSDDADLDAETWFRSPPDRSTSIQVEELLLDLVGAAKDDVVTIVAESNASTDGSTPERALQIRSVAWS